MAHEVGVPKRRRLIRSVMVGMVVYAGILALVYFRLNQPLHHVGKTVMVASGQTLWQFAKKYYPQNDPQQAVLAIMSANRIKNAGALQPGESIYLP